VTRKLPGQKRMYVLADNAGEYHRVGSHVMKRIARREDTRDVPLDVHPAKLPLPPQDPIWTKGAASALSDRAALLAHAQTICGVPISREITPDLRRALVLKPRPEDFI
jgi:hypothetical protein